MGKIIDLSGQRFGRLIVIELAKKRKNRGGIVWCCLCDCGNERFVRAGNLKSGNTKSCGCFALDIRTTHGMHKAAIYWIWDAMIQRCENPNNRAYKNYGGRGIKVCFRWHKFENFYADVGDPPEGKALDRIDNDGNYEPNNWKWSTRSEQQRNRRPTSCGLAKQRWFFAFNLNMGEWLEGNNQSEFARDHKLRREYIRDCLHKKRKTYEGWVFEFLP